jgi:hypothetical protein
MVRARLPLSARTSASFDTYVALESPILEKLGQGEPPYEALGVTQGLPRLRVGSWMDAASTYLRMGSEPSRAGHALKWFGIGLLDALGAAPAASHPRPWRDVFDKAEADSAREQAALVIGDYLADELWGLLWLQRGAFDKARSVTGALGCIASALAMRLVNEGARPDRAAAEAVLIVETGASQPVWRLIIDSAWPT